MAYLILLLTMMHAPMKVDTLPAVVDTTIYTTVDSTARYLGGEVAWNSLVRRTITAHYEDILKSGATGTCIVQFVVHQDGDITDVKAETMAGTLLSKLMMDLVRKSGPWMPAWYKGRSVASYRTQRVTVGAQN
jgi:hypothetical protein